MRDVRKSFIAFTFCRILRASPLPALLLSIQPQSLGVAHVPQEAYLRIQHFLPGPNPAFLLLPPSLLHFLRATLPTHSGASAASLTVRQAPTCRPGHLLDIKPDRKRFLNFTLSCKQVSVHVHIDYKPTGNVLSYKRSWITWLNWKCVHLLCWFGEHGEARKRLPH